MRRAGARRRVQEAAKPVELWLTMDRPVADKPADWRRSPRLPWAIAQGFRRETMQLVVDSRASAKRRHAANCRRAIGRTCDCQGPFGNIRLGQPPPVANARLMTTRCWFLTLRRTAAAIDGKRKVLDLPADKLPLLKSSNTLEAREPRRRSIQVPLSDARGSIARRRLGRQHDRKRSSNQPFRLGSFRRPVVYNSAEISARHLAIRMKDSSL